MSVSAMYYRVTRGNVNESGTRIKRITVEAPASIANLGPGFDIVSTSIENLFDIVEISISRGADRIVVDAEGFDVPSGEENVAYHVVKAFIEKYRTKGFDIYIKVVKGIPPGKGLGSSGATSAATAYGLSKIFSVDLEDRELLHLAGVGEAHVAGQPHYDNVAASLFGGFIILDAENLRVYRYVPKKRIPMAIIIPRTALPALMGTLAL